MIRHSERRHWLGITRLSLFGLFCVALPVITLLPAQSLAAKQESAGPEAVLFSQNCAACHGSDGRGGERAPNIATRHEIVSLSDAQLRGTLTKGVLAAGMPSFSYLGNEKIDRLVHYLRVLQGVSNTDSGQLPGDPRVGEQLFFGRASCSTCHMMHGRGGFMGEDLSDYAHGRSVEVIRTAIVHPDPGTSGHLVQIETSSGHSVRGLVRWQDNFTVVIQSEDGAFHSVPRDTITNMTTSSQALMPPDYGKTLNSTEVNDIASYLLSSTGPGKATPAADDDEVQDETSPSHFQSRVQPQPADRFLCGCFRDRPFGPGN